MRKSIILSFALIVGASLSSCDSSTDPGSNGTVTTRAEMTSSSVATTYELKDHVIGGDMADSLTVTKATVLFTNIKLHSDNQDSSGKGTLKLGPSIVRFVPGTASVISTASVPAGSYDKIKFEVHQYKGDDDKKALTDTTGLWMFSANGKQYSTVVEGFVWKNGASSPFTFYSDKNINVEIKFASPLAVSTDGTTSATIQLDPSLTFATKSGSTTEVYDPRDASNNSKIENLIKDAFKALKK